MLDGIKNKKPLYKRVWFIILLAIVVLSIFSVSFGGGETSSANKNSPKQISENNKEKNVAKNIESYFMKENVSVGNVVYNIKSKKNCFKRW